MGNDVEWITPSHRQHVLARMQTATFRGVFRDEFTRLREYILDRDWKEVEECIQALEMCAVNLCEDFDKLFDTQAAQGRNIMPNIKEIRDGGSDPNTPSVKEMRESQRKGSTGTGFDISIAAKNAARNHGTGLGEGTDERFPVAADYKEVSDGKLPWE